MIGHWIAFGLLFPVTFFGVIGFKEWTKKFLKTEITPEMEKAANIKVIKYILFCWLCNLFYMACFIDNLVCQYHVLPPRFAAVPSAANPICRAGGKPPTCPCNLSTSGCNLH